MLFYHCTTEKAAAAIMASGFRDRAAAQMGDGVWFTDDPDYMGGAVQLSIDIPTEVMGQYRLQYEDDPGVREWFAPASVINQYRHTLTEVPL